MILALSKFTVANGMANDVRAAFNNRPHLVDSAPGFIRMEVMNPEDNDREFWLFTWWENTTSFQDWHRSHQFHEVHQGIPKGLKLVPKSAELTVLQVVAN